MQPTHRVTLALLLGVGLLAVLIISLSARMTSADRPATTAPASPSVGGVTGQALTLPPSTPAPTLSGVTYYIAPTGDDTNTGTSINTPWRTLAKVNESTFHPGDRIMLQRGGLWRETLTVPSSGIAGQPLTIDAYGSGPSPIIDGADETGTPVRKIGISLDNRQYVVVQNLTVQNASSRNIDITNEDADGYNELHNLTVRNAVYPGIDLTDTGHNLIDSCEISGSGREGILLEFTHDPQGLGFNTFSHNRIHDNAMPGINLIGFTATQRTVNNSIHDNTIYNNGDGIYLHDTNYNDVSRNIIHDNNHRGYKGEGVGIPHMSSSYNDVHDNVIYGQRNSGIEYWGGVSDTDPTYGRADGNRAYRNHIYNNARADGAGIFLSSEYSNNTLIAYNVIDHNGSDQNNVSYGILHPNVPDTGTLILNNTLVANVRGQLRVKGTATIVRNNLLSNTGYDAQSDGSFKVRGDPKFVDPDARAFSLQARSPYIAAGADVSDLSPNVQAVVNQDITGNFIQGKRAVGAYEFRDHSRDQ